VAWARKKMPVRRRATYRRLKGTEQFLGFYDVHRDCLSGIFRKRKRLPDLFDAFRHLRACYSRKRLFVVMDNLHQTHDHPSFRRLLRKLRISPVWTPTESSWLNLVEAHFGVLKALHPREHRRPGPHHPSSARLPLPPPATRQHQPPPQPHPLD